MKKHTRRIGRLLGHLLLLVSLLAALGLFTGGLATSAHAAGSSITLSASSGTPGQSITVHGTGFGAGEQVNLSMDTTSLGSIYSNLNGKFTASFTVPLIAPNTYTVAATGVTSQDVATAPFTIPVFTTIKLSPATTSPGNYVKVTGQGFASQETVTISFNNAVVAVGQCATNGKLATSFVVPSSTPLATYTVTATGNSSALSASASLAVVSPFNWPQYGFNSAHTHNNPSETTLGVNNVNTLVKIWNFTASSGPFGFDSSPAVVHGVVYTASQSTDTVYALNASTGAKLWSFITQGYVSSPTVVKGVVYFASQNGSVYALNANNGNQIWTSFLGQQISSSPAVANGVVYIPEDFGQMYALNASTGATLWTYSVGASFSSPAVANGVVYFGGDDHNVYALNASTGAVLWSYQTGYTIQSSPAVINGVLYVGSDDQNVYAFGLP